MNGLRFVTLGVGNAFSARYYSTALALEAENTWLLVDCPHPIRKMLREAALGAGVQLDVGNISGIALTHLHADHSSGLECFGFYSRFPLNRDVQLLTHASVSEHMWEHHLAGSMEVSLQGPGQEPQRRTREYFFKVIPLSVNKPVEFGPFAVQCRPTNHSVPTTALKIWAGGRCLGYSADTAFDPALLDWLSPADLIIHECTPGFLHTPYEKLAALPADLRARMRLIHYDDDFDVDNSVIEALRQGGIYRV